MRLISLEPYITDILIFFGLGDSLVGVSHRCVLPDKLKNVVRVTAAAGSAAAGSFSDKQISRDVLLLDKISALKAEVIVASVLSERKGEIAKIETLQQLAEKLNTQLTAPVKLLSYAPQRLEQIYSESEKLAKVFKIPYQGLDLGKRAKAQLMSWGDNFYERMKNKKVTFLAGVEPLRLGGFWIPDMIDTLSAHSQLKSPAYEHPQTDWQSILDFKPDVMVVAPESLELKQSMATFKILEKLPNWENIPAVKRGEVVFCDGLSHFYNPGPKIIDSFGVMVSAIAGFESGYITSRDSFYRLRWLEMQRHRF